MTARERVVAELLKTRERIRQLVGAERNRDRVTRKRLAVYRRLRDGLPDEHPDVQKALERYRESRELSMKIDETQEVLRKRADNKVAWLEKHPPPLDPDGDGLIEIDGKQVSKGVGIEVLRIRSFGVWKGRVVSGYRTPEHSISLCMAMCGRPSCPGMCAGAASRHAQKGGRNGAVDLSDFIVFQQECVRRGSWLENHLPRDLVHFSDVGN